MKECTIKFIEDIRDPDYQVIQFHGQLDSHTLDGVKILMDKLFEKLSSPHTIFDFSDCNFINSNGIAFLMEAHAKLAHSNRQLIIAGAKSHVKDVFELMGLPKLLPVFNSMGEAIHAIKKK